MPPRPFHLPLRIGIDICQISRIKGIVAPANPVRGGSSAFYKKLLTPRELRYFKLRFLSPEQYRRDVEGQNIANYLAGRWAAKEACIKAFKPRKLTHSDVEIWPDRRMEMYAIVLDEPAEQNPRRRRDRDLTEHPDGEKLVTDNEADMVVEPETREGEVSGQGQWQVRGMHAWENVPSHEDVEGQVVRLSITHDTDYACAVALCADAEVKEEDVGGDVEKRHQEHFADSEPKQQVVSADMEKRLANIERELLRLRRAQGQRIGSLKK